MVEVKVIGGDRVKAVLDRARGGIGEEVAEAIDEVAEKVKADAKRMCPVDTGSLKASIRKMVVARPGGNRWEVSVRAGGYVTNPKTHRKVDYAMHVEYGTSNSRAQPFLRPAVSQNLAAIREVLSRAVGECIEKAAKE